MNAVAASPQLTGASTEGRPLNFNSTTLAAEKVSDDLNVIVNDGLERKRKLQPARHYLGASGIGYPCERQIQFGFAGAPKDPGKDFPPKTLRKFDLGHVSEELARCWFIDGGFELRNTSPRTGVAYGFEQMDGRFKGHPDGVFTAGPPGSPIKFPCLWEHKGVGVKTYREVLKDGLKKARPAYYAQTAIYQAYLGLSENPAIFTLTNLDSGEQRHLTIKFDAEEAQRMTDRAVRIIKSTDAGDLLPRPYQSADHFVCRMCAYADRCWGLPS